MYPHERSLVKQLADKPFAIIGVNSDNDLDEIRKVVKKKNLTWRSFQDEQDFGAISDAWGIQAWPSIFILDHEGKIRYRDVRGAAMDKAIEKLLGELGHEVTITHEEAEEAKPAKKKNRSKTNSPEDKTSDNLDETKSSDDK